MSGRCIEKLQCKCGKNNLQVFEAENGKFTGYCFSCGKYFTDPYNGAEPTAKDARIKPTAEEIAAELADISALPSFSLPTRKLSTEALSHFGVKVGVSEEDGITPSIRFYPFTKKGELSAYKSKLVDHKQMWCVGDMTDVDMFGWKQAMSSGAKKLFVTEGEDDAVALYQALKENAKGGPWEALEPAICSLSSGASSAKRDILRVAQDIKNNFKELVLVFDMDEAGDKARKDVLRIYPTAQTVSLPCKDANDCLMEGRSKALVNAVLFKSSIPKNTRIVNASSLYSAAREQAAWGLSWPWEGLTKLTRGIRFGETIYTGAGVKLGKSEWVDQVGAHLITEHDLKVFMAKPEQSNKQTIQKVLGKVARKIFYDPEIPFDYEAYDKAADIVGDKLSVLNLYQHMGWESLKDDIISAANDGVKAVFIDPITNLVNGVSAGETDTQLKEIAQELAAIAMDHKLVMFISCHLKAPQSGDSHERGGKVFSSMFAGSRGMMRSCNTMLGIEGNKDPDLPADQRNMRKLVILEDREFGASGTVNLFWDKNTGMFNEVLEL